MSFTIVESVQVPGAQYFIIKLESYEGEDTFVRCGDQQQDYLYCVAAVTDNGASEIIDNGYRSSTEASIAWPDAIQPLASQ